ncbi:ATP-dependent helicase/nuclease subunit A [Defluviimonas aquaemixtae]|uniref:DNA 3'-5' helicase n=1 Tax=Albidovulum aquaemixtae TaxID=1542388 RepID=A0A2R8BJD5_9RHOB|nr:ATP-dependent helicase/nuclease subunit A [Defluviimonas aquaemixtae]
MNRNDASQNQIRAADPAQSIWLSANAGSGKTRVLIDRVARLLLGGTEPQRILCLTYTKAAASEMQNRLFDRLGNWAMLPESELNEALRDLGVEDRINAETLAGARRLFARAIETPGGLKIQTIHSFCAAILRRFPLEARVSPNFSELDDRAARLMRQDIVEEIAAGPDATVFDALATHGLSEDLMPFLGEICRNRDYFSEELSRSEALAMFSLSEGFDDKAAYKSAFEGGESALIDEVAPILELQSKTMVELAATLRNIEPCLRPEEAFYALREVFLYRKDGRFRAEAKTASVPTKKAQEALGPLLGEFHALMARVAEAQDKLYSLTAAERTYALHRFARVFLPLYEERKARSGRLDFDDLITRSAALLSDRLATSWVLYKLDGGIDHILVDEAQDTSPQQWKVIERLAEEFTAGEGAGGKERTVFVVGDMKQSIYSFQGADLRAFEAMRDHFRAKYEGIATPFQERLLTHSFRSSEAILKAVDLTFDERVNRGLGGPLKHVAFRTDLPGRVDLWEAVPRAEKPEEREWFDPVDLLPDDHHTVILANRIAVEIRRMIDAGTRISTRDGEKTLDEGDIVILVQRRSELFHEIIRACKAAGLEIAGADRLRLGGELAVRDIAALMNFLATPEDDLSLAAALRSPLFGWSEGQLYSLAQGRGEGVYLWSALREKSQEHAETLRILDDLRGQADFLRPYDLIERLLTRHDGRRRLIGRLGQEAEDGIDALLAQALAFEQSEVPSLTGFIVWMETDDVEVKRRLDSASKAVRVMTVHGAKGLEAPVVFLPDTAKPRNDIREEIYRINDQAVWRTRTDESPEIIAEERAALKMQQEEERMRLLYVAMTRAEVWLITCGAGEMGEGTESWYRLVEAGLEKAGAARRSPDGSEFEFGPGLRLEHGNWPAPMKVESVAPRAAQDLPGWIATPAPTPPAPDTALSPSALGGAKALPGEEGLDEDSAKRRGTRLHALLEHLPLWREADWPATAEALLATGEDPAGPDDAAELLAEARGVLLSEDMNPFLVPGALAEVEIAAPVAELSGRVLHGTIDRLLVTADRVVAVDYKSNAIVPARPEDVPDGILRQMGAYAAMLGQIYPDRPIETAILWTRTGRLMPLPPDIVRAALRSTTIP